MQYGRYQIVAELGRGSMGVVYKAHDPQIDRLVALKVLREDRVTSEDFVRRFLKEAMAVGRLSHPGIVTVYDIGQDHGSIYIAMEFLQGVPLDEIMATRRFTLGEIISIGIQTARALHYAHQHGIIHRDIKPPNIIYNNEGTIRVTDFGIARIEDPNGHQMTQIGEVLGTPRYMSPEQIMGQPLDGRSDMYSLGVILYQLTTGKRPFQGATMAAIFRAITQDTPEPPHTLEPMLPMALSNLIMKLLEKDPAKRFSNGDRLIEALQSCLSSQPPPYGKTSASSSSRQKKNPGFGTMVIAGCVSLIVFAGTGGYFYLHRQPQPLQISNKIPAQRPDDHSGPIVQPQPRINESSTNNLHSAKPTIYPQEEKKTPSINEVLLHMESRPSGAEIYIDGSFIGKTPADLKIVAEKHEIKLRLDNYQTWQSQFDLSKGGEVPVSVILSPDTEGKQTAGPSQSVHKITTSPAASPEIGSIPDEDNSLPERPNPNPSHPSASTTRQGTQSGKSVKTSATSQTKSHSHPPGKQSVSGKRGSPSPNCQSLLKKYELGDASVIGRLQKECNGQ